MGLSKLSKKCRECPYVDTCQRKKMEAVAYISSPLKMPNAAPITINLTRHGDKISVLKEEIEKNMKIGLERSFTNERR